MPEIRPAEPDALPPPLYVGTPTRRILAPEQEPLPPALRFDQSVAYYDIENEPTSFRERFPLTKPIAIGWQIDGQTGHWAKGGSETLAEGLERFRVECWNPATLIAGHNIRQHDNPIVNAAMLRVGLAPLIPKMCRDTLRDLVTLKGIGRSLEALSIYFGLDDRKLHLAEAEWESLWAMDTPGHRALVIDRCLSDVALNIQIGEHLLARGWLKPPAVWRP